jgi:hypothetical protein
MADIAHMDTTLYGVEPYKESVNGAQVTEQNLIITAWNATEDEGGAFSGFGDLLIPVTHNDNVLAAKRAAGVQAMDSRWSSEIWLQNNGEQGGQVGAMLFVLNPPPELKQQLSQSVVFNGGLTTDLTNYTVRKSLQGCYVWQVKAWIAGASENVIQPDESPNAVFGTYLPLGDYTGLTDPSPMAFLKTNGADGVAPLFFDRSTEDGVAEMIAAVNRGDFYVPMFFDSEWNNPSHFQIRWPHSTARG